MGAREQIMRCRLRLEHRGLTVQELNTSSDQGHQVRRIDSVSELLSRQKQLEWRRQTSPPGAGTLRLSCSCFDSRERRLNRICCAQLNPVVSREAEQRHQRILVLRQRVNRPRIPHSVLFSENGDLLQHTATVWSIHDLAQYASRSGLESLGQLVQDGGQPLVTEPGPQVHGPLVVRPLAAHHHRVPLFISHAAPRLDLLLDFQFQGS